jgi:hypothetical protein
MAVYDFICDPAEQMTNETGPAQLQQAFIGWSPTDARF